MKEWSRAKAEVNTFHLGMVVLCRHGEESRRFFCRRIGAHEDGWALEGRRRAVRGRAGLRFPTLRGRTTNALECERPSGGGLPDAESVERDGAVGVVSGKW